MAVIRETTQWSYLCILILASENTEGTDSNQPKNLFSSAKGKYNGAENPVEYYDSVWTK